MGVDQNNNKNLSSLPPLWIMGVEIWKFPGTSHCLQLIAGESKVSLAWGLFPVPHFPPQHFPCAKRWGFVTLCCLYTPYPAPRINSIKFIKQLGLGEQFQKNLSESPLSFLNKFIPAGFMLLVHGLPTWIPAWQVRGRKSFGRANVEEELEAICKSWA